MGRTRNWAENKQHQRSGGKRGGGSARHPTGRQRRFPAKPPRAPVHPHRIARPPACATQQPRNASQSTHADPHPIRIGPARTGRRAPAPSPTGEEHPAARGGVRSEGRNRSPPLKKIPFFASRTASRLRSSAPAPVTPTLPTFLACRCRLHFLSSPSHSLDSRSQTAAHGASATNRCRFSIRFDCVPLYSHALEQVGEAYNN